MTSRILRLKALIEHTGLSRSAIYDRLDAKSPRHDPSFPKSFQLGGQAVGWYEAEVDAWLAKCADPANKVPAPVRKQPVIRTRPRTASAHHALHSSQSSEQRDAHKTLGDLIVEGGKINSVVEKYLAMPTWTPAMGALLANGVVPEDRCTSVPSHARGLDNVKLEERHPRLIAAQKLLDLFLADEEDGESMPSELTPLDFYIWCDESNVDTVWLRHFNAVAGITKADEDLSSAAFALLTRR